MSDQYRKFYSKYKDKLFNYLLCRCGNVELAKDVMQDSFTRHLQCYGDTVAISPALLFTIARNKLIDNQRIQGRFRRIENNISTGPANIEDHVIARDECAQLKQAIDNLTDLDRKMLAMAVKGVGYDEIGKKFNMSVANVKVRIHRTRLVLREQLKTRSRTMPAK